MEKKRIFTTILNTDFFENEQIQSIRNRPKGDTYLIIYLKLLLISLDNNGTIFYVGLEDSFSEEIALTIDEDEICTKEALYFLYKNKLLSFGLGNIKILKPQNEIRDRGSYEYKKWREQVFLRDGYCCQECGSKEHIQAHHIESWKRNKTKRFDVNNGITLCRECHLKAHNGCWRN